MRHQERFFEIFRFLLVGGGCFLLDWGLLYGLHEYGGLSVLLSSGISFSVSLAVNYILCVTVVFHAEKRTRMQTVLFVVSSLLGLGVNQLCMWGLTALTGDAWYMADKIGAAAVVTIWNYITKRLILRGWHDRTPGNVLSGKETE